MERSTPEQLSLADVKSRLSEVIDGVEAEHSRVVITRHGKPAAVLLSLASDTRCGASSPVCTARGLAHTVSTTGSTSPGRRS